MKVCCIVPCYNEEYRFRSYAFEDFSRKNTNYYFIFVNDGSVDKTKDVLESLEIPNDRIKVLDLKKNKGKAEAVRIGILEGLTSFEVDVIGFVDADLSTPMSEIKRLITFFDKQTCFVFASRFQRIGSNIERRAYRHYLGRVFATIASIILNLKVYDTQCGAKFFKVDTAKYLFKNPFLTKWIFDLELFFRLINLVGLKGVEKLSKEVPINKWEDVAGSKISFKYFFILPFDLIKLYRHYKKSNIS